MKKIIFVYLIFLFSCSIASQSASTSNTPSVEKNLSVSAGEAHTLILDDGKLFAAGRNDYGQLGDGTNINTNKFLLILSGVKSISASGLYSAVLKNDDSLWMTGNNEGGQFGNGADFEATNVFLNVMSNIKSIVCGGSHSFIISNDGSLFVAGDNQKGQLGIGINTSTNRFVYVMKNISSVGCGFEFSMIISNDGTLWGAGNNNYGQLGQTSFFQQINSFTSQMM